MSWRITADIREMFVELTASNGQEAILAQTFNRKDVLLSGFIEALNYLPSDLDRKTAELYVTTDLERISVRERWFNPAVLLATEGFENLLEIGNQTRTSLFGLYPEKKRPLIGHEACYGVTERIRADGTVELTPDDKEIEFVAGKLKMSEITHAAICFLHSDKNPIHEHQLAEKLKSFGIDTVCSNEFAGNEIVRAERAVVKAQLLSSHLRILEDLQKLGFEKEHIHILPAPPPENNPKNLVKLTLIEDRSLATFENQTFELKVCGLSRISLDDGGLVQIGPQIIGSEPGPVSFGKGLILCLMDLLVCARGFGFEEIPKLKIDPNRVLRQLSPMAKQLQLSPETTAEKFLNLAFDMIALELRTLAALAGIDFKETGFLCQGLLAKMVGPEITKRLVVKKLTVPPNSQWARSLALHSDLPKNLTLQLKGRSRYAGEE